jgi:hypothetical protein
MCSLPRFYGNEGMQPDMIASVPMLLREKKASSNSFCVLRIINMTEPWVNSQALIIELEPENV